MDLDDLLKQVNSKETFLEFVSALMKDKIDEDEKEKNNPSSPYSSGHNGWENNTIAMYLESIHAYGEDNEMITAEPNWNSFALLLYSGKFYE